MTRNIFGWSLPPGVSQRMIDEAYGGGDPSPLEEAVLFLLETAGIPQATCDKICELIQEAEAKLQPKHPEEDDR